MADPFPLPTDLEPMAARTGDAVPEGDDWVFEPKYDGVRVLAYAAEDAARIVTRNGNDKSSQFPDVTEALRALAAGAGAAVVLDGELVALEAGRPARFQELQGRIHLADEAGIARAADEQPAALIAFDLLAVGDDVLLDAPWSERRRRLDGLLGERASERLRLGASPEPDGEAMLERAREAGWEGIIAKRVDATYRPGKRSRDWLKLKVEFRQEFVVGGWTEPRKTRKHLGALVLGYFDPEGRLVHAGNMGGGFSRASLEDMFRRLEPLERENSPFVGAPPRTPTAAHWVRPEVVVEARFSEWTADGKLRQPIFLGVREDKKATEVVREPGSVQGG